MAVPSCFSRRGSREYNAGGKDADRLSALVGFLRSREGRPRPLRSASCSLACPGGKGEGSGASLHGRLLLGRVTY
jgi:hypothetical protein